MTRDLLDFYETPPEAAAIGAALVLEHAGPGSIVLDPAAGRGALLKAARAQGMLGVGIEFDTQRAAISESICDDAISCASWPPAHAVLMNPPFNRAEAFVGRALRECPVVVALLRLTFLGSLKRRRLFEHKGRPKPDFHLLADRPSFNEGGTDTADVCWFVWAPTSDGRWSRIERKT